MIQSPVIGSDRAKRMFASMELDLEAFYRVAMEKAMEQIDRLEWEEKPNADAITGFALMFGEEGEPSARVAKEMIDLMEIRRG